MTAASMRMMYSSSTTNTFCCAVATAIAMFFIWVFLVCHVNRLCDHVRGLPCLLGRRPAVTGLRSERAMQGLRRFLLGKESLWCSPLGLIDRGLQQIPKPFDVQIRGVDELIHWQPPP